MAEKALQKVEDDLTCSICLATYTDPKLLECHHVFCRKCLKGLARNQEELLSITCPTCRKVTTISVEKGVAGLQSAFHINSLLSILSEHKKFTKEHSIVTEEQERDTEEPDMATTEKQTSSMQKDKKAVEDAHYCPDHSARLLDSFCETCDTLICIECAFEHHKGHECNLISRLFKKSKKEILSSLSSVENYLEWMRQSVDAIQVRHAEVLEQQETLVAEVSEHAQQIQVAAEARKLELVSTIDHITKDKLNDLASQTAKTEKIITQVCNYVKATYKDLETSSEEKVVKMKSVVAQQTKTFEESFQPESLDPSAKADTIFSAKFGIKTAVRSFGDVYTSGSPGPAQVRASGDGLKGAIVGEKSTVILQSTVPTKGPWMKLKPSLECDVFSEFSAKKVKHDIETSGRNRLEITYKPATKGRHQIHIKVKGEHIRGSPFVVNAVLPFEKLGKPLLIFAAERPRGIAINKDGKVVIIEVMKRHLISIFNPQGNRIDCYGNRGFKYPSRLAVDNKGNILVVDKEADCIWRLTPDELFSGKGQQVAKFGDVTGVDKARVGVGFGAGMGLGAGIGAGIAGPIGGILGGAIGAGVGALRQVADTLTIKLHRPRNIAFNAKNKKVYVLDEKMKEQIQVLNSDLTFSRAFGESGNDKGQLSSPWGIACDSSGKVYVADSGNNRIQVFTAEGEFVRMFGNRGTAQERVYKPHGIAVDSNGIVYVSEPYNHCISVFTAKGRFVKSFSTLQKDEEQHDYGPTELVVDDQGIVYVCEPLYSKVKVF